MSEKPVRGIAVLFGLALGVIVLGITMLVLPVQWSEANLRFRLWRAGARPVLWEKHRGFTVDRCAGKPAAECECVWLIHGMGDSVVTWRNFFYDARAFGDRPVRIFAIDLPGHGGSLRRHDLAEYRASNIAREIDAGVAATTACVKNDLVGNSFGGHVTAEMALLSPGRYARLVLVSPSGTAAAEAATQDLFRDGSVAGLKEFQRRAYFKPRELTDSEWAKAVSRMTDGGVGEVRSAQVPADRLDARLAKIAVPTTIVWGEADRIIPRAVVDEFLRKIPRAKLATIPECGHLPQKECPEKLFSILREKFP